MKNLRSFRRAMTGGGLLLLLGLFVTLARAELKLPTLRTKQGTYTNVVVTGKTDSDLYIRHQHGFGNVKLEEIEDDAALVALGLKAPPVKVELVTNTVAGVVTVSTNEPPPAPESSTARYQEQLREQWARLQRYRPAFELTSGLLALGVVLAIHLFFSFCLKQICVKAGRPPGVAVWLPVLQAVPALRAAGMSAGWLLAWVLPVLAVCSLPLLWSYGSPALVATGVLSATVMMVIGSFTAFVGQVIWCFKITSARGKSILVAILLLLPVLNLFAFLYLAFSASPEE